MRRILILPSWYPPDGGYFFKEHSEAISKTGWKVEVLVNRVVGVRKLLQAGLAALRPYRVQEEDGLQVARSIYLKVPGSEELNIRRWSHSTLRLYSRYRKRFGQPDLILCHSATWAGYAASLIRERFGTPYLVVEHRSFFVWSTPQARDMVKSHHLPYFEKAYRHCEHLVLVSESLLRGLKELFPWIDRKTLVIPNMIREDMFPMPEGKRKTDPFVFFWAGRLEHVKGIDLLIRAVGGLTRMTEQPFRVRLAGRGSLRDELEKLVEEEGMADRITFLGRISRERMQEEMRGANCFVLPTRYEAFGAVLIEAMATGLPVIATRSGGPDFIVNEKNGILIDPEDPEQLAGTMHRMMKQYDRFDPVAIRSDTMERFGEKKVMERFNQLFELILE